jgi:DNA-binding transcriptional MerR regulator
MSSLRTIPSAYSIGQLSRLFGVTPRALRFYEQIGLVEPDRDGPARIYSRGDYQRLKVIVGARKAGLKLEHIRELLNLYEPTDHGAAQVRRAIGRLRERIAELDAQRELAVQSLAELEARLERIEPSAANDQSLNANGAARRAH